MNNGTIGADNSCWMPGQISVWMWIWRYWYRDTRSARPPNSVSEPFVYPVRSVRGRSEAMLPHYNAREGETIQHVDVMSLYPYICKYFKFRVCYSFIHVWDACKDKVARLRKDGLIKCSIVPPERFYHPVIPFWANQKIMFCFCWTCVLTWNTGECWHTTEKRWPWQARVSLTKYGWPCRRDIVKEGLWIVGMLLDTTL